MTDLTNVSSADLAAALQARQLAAIEPLVPGLTALQGIIQTTQAALQGISNTESVDLASNVQALVSGYLVTATTLVAKLTPPPPAPAASS